MNMTFVLGTSVQDSYYGTMSKIGFFCSGVLQKVSVIFEFQVFHQNITWKRFKGFIGLLLALSPGFEDKKVNWNLK